MTTECCCKKNCCKMDLQLPSKKNFKYTYPKCTPNGYGGVGNTSGLYINKTVKLDNLATGSKILQKNKVNGTNPTKAPLINNPNNLNKKIDLNACCDYQCICPQFLSDEEINELYLQALNSDIYWSTSSNINDRNKKINKVKYCLDQCFNKIEECKCCAGKGTVKARDEVVVKGKALTIDYTSVCRKCHGEGVYCGAVTVKCEVCNGSGTVVEGEE